MKYKCIKPSEVPVLDEYENETGDYMAVQEGSIWEMEELCPFSPKARLVSEGYWIEISYEKLKECFEEVEEERK